MEYWKTAKSKKNELYSIDKVVMQFKLPLGGGQLLLDSVATTVYGGTHWTSRKFGTFREQFSVEVENGNTYWLGIGLNGTKLESDKARLEFNPNKVANATAFKTVFRKCFNVGNGFTRPRVKQFDLAVDFAVERAWCDLVKDRRLYEEVRYSDSNRTQYLGQRNAHGRCKLYNKSAEQGLNSPLTRLEVTISFEESSPDNVRGLFPKVRVLGGVEWDTHETLSDTDEFIYKTLVGNPERLAELGRRKQDKFRELIESKHNWLEFDSSAYMAIYVNVLNLLAGVL